MTLDNDNEKLIFDVYTNDSVLSICSELFMVNHETGEAYFYDKKLSGDSITTFGPLVASCTEWDRIENREYVIDKSITMKFLDDDESVFDIYDICNGNNKSIILHSIHASHHTIKNKIAFLLNRHENELIASYKKWGKIVNRKRSIEYSIN